MKVTLIADHDLRRYREKHELAFHIIIGTLLLELIRCAGRNIGDVPVFTSTGFLPGLTCLVTIHQTRAPCNVKIAQGHVCALISKELFYRRQASL